MRIVIDTNVYLSHFKFGGIPSQVCRRRFLRADVFLSEFYSG